MKSILTMTFLLAMMIGLLSCGKTETKNRRLRIPSQQELRQTVERCFQQGGPDCYQSQEHFLAFQQRFNDINNFPKATDGQFHDYQYINPAYTKTKKSSKKETITKEPETAKTKRKVANWQQQPQGVGYVLCPPQPTTGAELTAGHHPLAHHNGFSRQFHVITNCNYFSSGRNRQITHATEHKVHTLLGHILKRTAHRNPDPQNFHGMNSANGNSMRYQYDADTGIHWVRDSVVRDGSTQPVRDVYYGISFDVPLFANPIYEKDLRTGTGYQHIDRQTR